jgi:hypothetical protein
LLPEDTLERLCRKTGLKLPLGDGIALGVQWHDVEPGGTDMNAIDRKSEWGRAAVATLGLGALLVTVGCGSRDASGVSAQALTTSQAGVPVVVTCEPHQRTVVRPVVVNGATMSQVECVAGSQVSAGQPYAGYAPAVQPRQAYVPVRATDPGYAELGDARVVPVASAPRPVPARQVVYEERRAPVKQGRSVKKSAIIIGSSAGVGAGVGAAVGGKKGALIGAAIGGGSAAIWDQVTRRK